MVKNRFGYIVSYKHGFNPEYRLSVKVALSCELPSPKALKELAHALHAKLGHPINASRTNNTDCVITCIKRTKGRHMLPIE